MVKLFIVFTLISLFLAGCISSTQGTRERIKYDPTNLIPEETPTPEEPEAVTRPDGQVYIQPDFCSCLSGKSDIVNNCESKCASLPASENPTLFVNTKLGPDIELTELGSLQGWCNTEIDDGNKGPSCSLEFYDGFNTGYLNITIGTNSNSFTADIRQLEYDKTYRLRLIENTSGSSSDYFQLRRVEQTTESNLPDGPLKMLPISQYTCVMRAGGTEPSGDDIFINAARMHFYFPPNNSPVALPAGDDFLFCHDIRLYGNTDSSIFPRLELVPNSFRLWDPSDLRFYDIDRDVDNKMEIHQIIEERLKKEFGMTGSINLFHQFQWLSDPLADNSILLGYMLQPFTKTNVTPALTYCPTQTDYVDPGNPIANILGDLIGEDTEGVYFALKDPEILISDDGSIQDAPMDVLVIREGLLKQIWFYYEDGQHYLPDEISATQKTIKFYWPADTANPYVKKSTQRVYTIRDISTLNSPTATDSGARTDIPSSDKRFGCVPKTPL